MAKPKPKRKTRSDKFPLTLHPTGQYCKRIKGKLYYFGVDRRKALERYLEQATYLHTGKGSKPKSTTDSLSIKTLCNLYLEHQESGVAIGEIEFHHFNDQISILRNFVKFISPNRLVSEIPTVELQNYRTKLIKMGKAAYTINNVIATIKAMYNWAMDNEVIDNIPNLKAIKKVVIPKPEKPTFTVVQIQKLLENTSAQMRAMILLGLNCGFGRVNCGSPSRASKECSLWGEGQEICCVLQFSSLSWGLGNPILGDVFCPLKIL